VGAAIVSAVGIELSYTELGVIPLVASVFQALVLCWVVTGWKKRALTVISWPVAMFTSWLGGLAAGLLAVFVIGLVLYGLGIVGDTLNYLASPTARIITWSTHVTVAGILLGIGQQQILGARVAPKAKWVRIGIVAWLAAWVVGLVVGWIFPGSDPPRITVGAAVGAAVFGVTTGRLLARLVDSPVLDF